MSDVNLGAAKAFIGALDEFNKLINQWTGWSPHCAEDVEKGLHPLYEDWQRLTKDHEGKDISLWQGWNARCKSSTEISLAIGRILMSNVAGVVQLVNGDGGDSRKVLQWVNIQVELLAGGPWMLATPNDVRSLLLNGSADFDEVYFLGLDDSQKEVREIVVHAMMTAEPTEFDGDKTPTSQQGRKKKRMTIEEANDAAMKVAKQLGKAFFAMSEREQARRIGCSWTTWTRTTFFLESQKKMPPRIPKQPSSPKAVSFTPAVEAVTAVGERDEVLKALAAEQEADREPSPLESDPPDRPRRTRSRKRM